MITLIHCSLWADLLLKYEKSAIAVLPQIGECLNIVQDPKGIAAVIWIIGEYGQVWCPLLSFCMCYKFWLTISIGNHTVTHKCKLISNWTRKTGWLLININTNMKKFARKKCRRCFSKPFFSHLRKIFSEFQCTKFWSLPFTWDH